MKRHYFVKQENNYSSGLSKSAHNIIKLILMLLSGRGYFLFEITDTLKISERTAYRYLQQICNEGFLLYRVLITHGNISYAKYFIETKIHKNETIHKQRKSN